MHWPEASMISSWVDSPTEQGSAPVQIPSQVRSFRHEDTNAHLMCVQPTAIVSGLLNSLLIVVKG